MTIVLLPGLHGTDELFSWLIEYLNPYFQVLAVQYPKDECLSYAVLAERIGPTLPKECIIVAESFAGPLSVLLATAYPERVKGIVFSGSFIKCPVSPLLKRLHGILTPLLVLTACIPANLLEQIAFRFGGYQFLLEGNSNAELFAQLRKMARKLNPSVILFRIRQLLNTDVSAEFAKLTFPMTYLHGINDRLVSEKNHQWMCSLNHNLKVRESPCGHLILQIHPKEAAKEIQNLASIYK